MKNSQNTAELITHFSHAGSGQPIAYSAGRIEPFTPASTNDVSKITLLGENQTRINDRGWGLCLWSHLNEHLIGREDHGLVVEEEPKTLRKIKFQFDKVIEWTEWREICVPRMEYAKTLEIPHLPELLPHNGKCAIVGAGPTVIDFTKEIKKFKDQEIDMLMSVNATHDWLIKQGIVPKIHVISEHDIEDIELSLGGPPHKDVYYYIASMCNERTFKQLEGYHRVLFHQYIPPQEYQAALDRIFPGEFMIGGGYATFFKSLTIAIILGYRNFDLFGMDSSFNDSSHMNGYKVANREDKITIWGADITGRKRKRFTTQGGLAYQAKEFLEFCKFNHEALKIRIHGDSLLRFVHETRYPEQYR